VVIVLMTCVSVLISDRDERASAALSDLSGATPGSEGFLDVVARLACGA